MRQIVVKYFLEFFVIVIGISISFYVENYNEAMNKEEYKTIQSSGYIDFISKKPPFIFKYDGKTQHQLIKLNL